MPRLACPSRLTEQHLLPCLLPSAAGTAQVEDCMRHARSAGRRSSSTAPSDHPAAIPVCAHGPSALHLCTHDQPALAKQRPCGSQQDAQATSGAASTAITAQSHIQSLQPSMLARLRTAIAPPTAPSRLSGAYCTKGCTRRPSPRFNVQGLTLCVLAGRHSHAGATALRKPWRCRAARRSLPAAAKPRRRLGAAPTAATAGD